LGLPWTDVSGSSATMAVNNAYTANNAGLVTLTLPALAAYGSLFFVVGKGAGGWKIAQNAGQTIHINASSSTAGITGSLASTAQYNTAWLLCSTENTDFIVLSHEGILTLT